LESVAGFDDPEPDEDEESDLLPELSDEPLDNDLSEPDFEPDSDFVPDSDFELSELSPDLPFEEPPLTAPARLSVR
jgi:hypothetical protein